MHGYGGFLRLQHNTRNAAEPLLQPAANQSHLDLFRRRQQAERCDSAPLHKISMRADVPDTRDGNPGFNVAELAPADHANHGPVARDLFQCGSDRR